jgi:hypothetical protein
MDHPANRKSQGQRGYISRACQGQASEVEAPAQVRQVFNAMIPDFHPQPARILFRPQIQRPPLERVALFRNPIYRYLIFHRLLQERRAYF